MGLAAPKNRSRISNDPQNTTWANNTTRFGHRILTQQGWTPGSSLGATDAAHAAHYTAASQSHIRVLLKDDNLGLGAKRGSERAENFGLAGFASILGRLNGKAEEVKKEEERQEKIQQRAYVYNKYGFMNFVSGGFLVGDKIEKGIKRVDVEVKVEPKSEPESSDSDAQEKKSKKRKRSGEEDDVKQEDQDDEEPKLKRKRKSINLREDATQEDDETPKSKKDKKDKKDKKEKKEKKEKKSKSTSETSTTETPASASEPLSDKARRKAEKRARKEEKKLKKALKKAAKEAAKSNPTTEDPSSESSDDDETTPTTSAPTTGTSTPASSASGLTYTPRGMHAVRHRYIRNKKMASMDPQALKEIFMIKTPS